MYSFQKIYIEPEIPERIKFLKDLAYNMWFSWHGESHKVFSLLDPDLWVKCKQNPVKFLLEIDHEKLEIAAQDTSYLTTYDQVIKAFQQYLDAPTWYSSNFSTYQDFKIAYFSAEFGVHESNPVYSGGLGLLAGDHCKEASDLGLPLIGMGLLYKQGYFAQRINQDGWQEAHNTTMDFSQKTVQPVHREDESEILITVKFPGRDILLKIWHQRVGRMRIFFLDADLPENSPNDRLLTSKLYGGDQLTRISQEMILGIGGVKALRELGIQPSVWHINEGHAAFSLVERFSELTTQGIPFSIAKEIVRANSVFTTHTPVPAGHDVFPPDLVDGFFTDYYHLLGLSKEQFLALGQENPHAGFNMTALALKHCNYTNGVSKLHCEVSKKMFQNFYKDIPPEEIPIEAITNGVHTETWLAPDMKKLFDKYLKEDWNYDIDEPNIWKNISKIPDGELWKTHQKLKEKMINMVIENLGNRLKRNFENGEILDKCISNLDPKYLTIGFARRFATYKRADLLFKDEERLLKILNNPEMPVRIIIAGKAHPADHPGQKLIKMICDLEKNPLFCGKIIFVENYDINIARYLLQGVDVWLNTPRRPLEASGTSGQKAAVNGVLNCSILDGWWPEAYNGKNGYAIGTATEYNNEELQDIEDANSLYTLLEKDLIPTYYKEKDGLPVFWLQKIRNSLKTIPYYFSTERMIKEYFTHFYLPAHIKGKEIETADFLKAELVEKHKSSLQKHWESLKIKEIRTNSPSPLKKDSKISFEAEVYLGSLAPKDVIVEIVYGKVAAETLTLLEAFPMNDPQEIGEATYKYTGEVILKAGLTGYNLRIRPNNALLSHPFELPLVKWAEW